MRVSLGVNVAGVDLAHLDNRDFNRIFRALLEHLLVCIEGQSLTAAAFRSFALRFGALLPAPSPAPSPGAPRHP